MRLTKNKDQVASFLYAIILIAAIFFIIGHFDRAEYWKTKEIQNCIRIVLISALLSTLYRRFINAGWESMLLPPVMVWLLAGVSVEFIAVAWAFAGFYVIGRHAVKFLGAEERSVATQTFVGLAVAAAVLPAVDSAHHGFYILRGIFSLLPLLILKDLRLLSLEPETSWLSSMAHAGLAALLAYASVFCLLPDITFDSHLMHLNIPFRLNMLGWADLDPLREYWAFYPQGIDHLYALVTVGFDLISPKIFNFVSLAVFGFAISNLFQKRIAIFVILFSLACPAILQQTAQSFIDLVWSELIVLGVFTLLVKRGQPQAKLGLVFIAAACASKIVSVCYLLPVLPFIWGPFRRSSVRQQIGLVLVVVLSVWWLWMGAIKTGNPIFPLYNDVFKSNLFTLLRFEDGRWHQPLSWKMLYNLSAYSEQYGEVYPGVFSVLWLFTLPCAALFTWNRSSSGTRSASAWALALIVISGLLVLALQPYYRYFMPTMLGIIALSTVGFSEQKAWLRWTFGLCILAGATSFIGAQGWFSRDIAQFLSPIRRLDYAEKNLPHIPIFRALNADASVKNVFVTAPEFSYEFGLLRRSYLNNHYSSIASSEFGRVDSETKARIFLSQFEITHLLKREKESLPVWEKICGRQFALNGFEILKCSP